MEKVAKIFDTASASEAVQVAFNNAEKGAMVFFKSPIASFGFI